MKIIALLLAICAIARADVGWNMPNKALNIRGGAVEIGPLNGAMAMKLAKTATIAYAAGSGSKYIAGQTGGTNAQLADFVTTDMFALNALCTAFAAGMFKLAGTGFDPLKTLAASQLLALFLKMDSDGISTDTVMANKVQTVITVLTAVLAFAP
eukprot:CAMPEP_0119003024 /NCGR_PEP_ID=MMETSP1176-20130426/311_1 /TAXON_ID=265551 /ORGANISM="Synedropsis recta cf, Strain CCMP1620" /LENGTH=153 /DNA_ID=CAMNT_0006954583 /DNA_START=51 /DNA_END=512 /DNA_ORIENTATION=+